MKINRLGLLLGGLLTIVMGVSTGFAKPANTSDQGARERWTHKGFVQHHNLQSNNVLSSIGTQYYFSTADKVVNLPVETVEPVVEPVAAPAPAPEPEKNLDDLDEDGVLNADDLCPDTPKGETVNQQGCWILGKVYFLFDQAVIQKESIPELNRIVAYLRAHPELDVELQGHTDSTGPAIYNDGLSLRRAKAVMKYFVKQDIAASRMRSVGFGESRPVNDNSSKRKRYYNRRVEVHPFRNRSKP